MKTRSILFLISIFLFSDVSLFAQANYSLNECGERIARKRTLGDRLKFAAPTEAKTKKGRDVDYAEYSVGFHSNSGWVWLSGIYGPSATSGHPPRFMTEQNIVSRRSWSFNDVEGIDMSGRTASGNYWRYIGTQGEAIRYFDVPKEAAKYFDSMLDSVCYNPSGGISLSEN
jgi:hypothetical protein